jgi:hypothetical protein
LSVEQLRELQSLVQRALESSRTSKIDSGEVAFDWSPRELGRLQFHIRTEESAVHIEIISDQPRVVDMIQQSRAVVERMIQDQGMRVEHFDVQFRNPSEEHERLNHSPQWTHRDAPSSPSPDSTGAASADESNPPETTAQHSLYGERVWVA